MVLIQHLLLCVGSNSNGVVEYNGDGGWEGGRGYGGWDGGRGYGGRVRGRGRGRGYRGRGRGYGSGEIQQEFGGYNDYDGPGVMPAQGRGKIIFFCSVNDIVFNLIITTFKVVKILRR